MASVDIGTIFTRFQVKDIDKQLEKLAKVEQQLERIEGKTASIKIDTQGVQTAEREMSRLEAGIRRLSTGFNQIGKGAGQALTAIAQPIRNTIEAMNTGSRFIRRFGDQVTHMGQIAAATAFRLQLLTTPIQAFAAATAKQAVDIQHAITLIGTQTNLTGGELEAFRERAGEAIRGVTNEFAVGAKDSADALFNLVASLNISEDAAAGLLPILGKFAVAGDTTASSVSELSTLLLASFAPDVLHDPAMAVSELEEMLTQVFVSMKAGRGTFEQFVEQIGDFARIGQTAGASLPELLSLFTILTRTRPISEASTQLKRLTQTLIEPKFAEEMEGLGIAMTMITGEGVTVRRGAFDILGDLADMLNAMPESERLETIAEVFPNIRAELPFLEFLVPSVRKEFDGLSDSLGDITEITPEVMQAINDMNTTVTSRLTILGNTAVNLGAQVERSLRGRVLSVINALIDGFMALQNLPPATQQRLAEILLIVSALPPALLALSVAILGAGGIVSAIGALASPTVLGIAALGMMAFGTEFRLLSSALKEFDLTSLDGIATLIAEIALATGLLNEQQVASMFESLNIDANIGQEYFKIKEAIDGIAETVRSTVGFVRGWVDAFGEFFDMVSRREGIVGNLARIFDLFGKIAGTVPGGIFEGRAGTIDAALGVFLSRQLLGMLKNFGVGLMNIKAGVVNVVGGARGAIAGAPAAAGAFMSRFGRFLGPLGLLGGAAAGEELLKRQFQTSPSAHLSDLQKNFPDFFTTGRTKIGPFAFGGQFREGLEPLLTEFGKAKTTEDEQVEILEEIHRRLQEWIILQKLENLPEVEEPQEAAAQIVATNQITEAVIGRMQQEVTVQGQTDAQAISSTFNNFQSDFIRGAQLQAQAVAFWNMELDEVLAKTPLLKNLLPAEDIEGLRREIQEVLREAPRFIRANWVPTLNQVVEQINHAFNTFNTALQRPTLPRAMPNTGGGGRASFHTGGFIDMLQSEFVTSPLTTRMLEGVIGTQLTQQNLRQMALARAGISDMRHDISITPSGTFNIALEAQGMGGFKLTRQQEEELGWKITGMVADHIRTTMEQ